jgi:hypothetical protein
MGDQLNNLRQGYHTLERRVISALRTQLGDRPRLVELNGQALALAAAAEQV